MTYPTQDDDPIAPYLLPAASSGPNLDLRFRTARVIGWSQEDGGWSVEFDGVTMTPVRVIGGPWVGKVRAGDHVAMIGAVDNFGMTTWTVLGHILPADQAVELYGAE